MDEPVISINTSITQLLKSLILKGNIILEKILVCLFLKKNRLVRCWDSCYLLNWIAALNWIGALLPELPPRKLAP